MRTLLSAEHSPGELGNMWSSLLRLFVKGRAELNCRHEGAEQKQGTKLSTAQASMTFHLREQQAEDLI